MSLFAGFDAGTERVVRTCRQLLTEHFHACYIFVDQAGAVGEWVLRILKQFRFLKLGGISLVKRLV